MLRVKWYGKQIAGEMKRASAEALFAGSEVLLEEANRTCPHDEGTLERSGETSVDKDKLEAAASYDTPYAVRLHEHPEYRFQSHGGSQRRGKWLELTLKEQGKRVRDAIAEIMRKAHKGGI